MAFVDTLLTLVVLSLTLGGVYTLISLGLTLIFGVMDIVNMAHGGMIMIGGFMAFAFTQEFAMNPLVSIVVVVPVMFALGYLLQAQLLERLKFDLHMNSLLFTFGFAVVIEALLTLHFGNSPKFINAFDTSIPINVGFANVVAGVGGYIGAASLYVFLQRSETGRAIRATAQVPDLAEASGINVPYVRSITFGIASVLAGIGGVLYLLPYQISPIGGQKLLVFSFIIVALGGLGSLRGAAVSAVIIATLQMVITYYVGSTTAFMVLLFGAVAVLLVTPNGLFGDQVRA
ncbi:branched-chain amino acid ABC transporter permease [Halorubellus sp. JP-L1]|uniref:branched-chain amino acid ABC transporter permease n=1 Tax=Halorubellus sp. JP-L1 TaxID=2715753 RepID=UPI00140DD582|nr:branched-chain amino acid ABC transporter permease [Halorubellus sp. JP-L1]NHN42813.1 branched-chain amino acid ABC transporter permease [Halorubellus sp. JP-L1]